MTELAIPAGSLQAAVHAFASGADAVYFGLQRFSARKAARNFSFEDLRRIKQLASTLGKRIYVTINTLVSDDELADVRSFLKLLVLAPPDGVIVQDLGIAQMLRSEFGTSLALHASTQLAVHTIDGVKVLQDLGFSRVVLARELTLEEIGHIRTACRDIELKAFIHGALCYGFSGLCMASHLLAGRSANRGECAQICRTWFSLADTRSGRVQSDGYWFSMSDLESGVRTIQALQQMGIDSLKVEGRMKSPAYAAATARLYRLMLDGETNPEVLGQAAQQARTEFSRLSSGGWLADYGRKGDAGIRHGSPLSCPDWTGHRGIPAGMVLDVGETSSGRRVVRLKLSCPLAVRDGLLVLDQKTLVDQPSRFSLERMWNASGNLATRAEAGEQVAIMVPKGIGINTGSTLHKISSHDANLPQINEQSLAPYRHPLDMHIEILPDALALETAIGCTPDLRTVKLRYAFPVQQANHPRDVHGDLLEKLKESGESLITCGNLMVHNASGLPSDRIFLPSSLLKQMRRAWYAHVDRALAGWIETNHGQSDGNPNHIECRALPDRSQLVSGLESGRLPWIDVQQALQAVCAGNALDQVLPVIEDCIYIPLSPVTFNERADRTALQQLVEMLQTQHPELRMRIGMNNPAHIAWMQFCRGATCFADIYLYCQNRLAAKNLCAHAPALDGMYYCMESDSVKQDPLQSPAWPCRPSSVGARFKPPLFISRSCFRHDSLGLSCEGCPRYGNWEVVQQGHRYTVVVSHCITIVSASD